MRQNYAKRRLPSILNPDGNGAIPKVTASKLALCSGLKQSLKLASHASSLNEKDKPPHCVLQARLHFPALLHSNALTTAWIDTAILGKVALKVEIMASQAVFRR